MLFKNVVEYLQACHAAGAAGVPLESVFIEAPMLLVDSIRGPVLTCDVDHANGLRQPGGRLVALVRLGLPS